MKTIPDEADILRRCVRDLVALSTLPVVWGKATPSDIAGSLAEILQHSLSVDFLYVRVEKEGEGIVGQAACVGRRALAASQVQPIGQALLPWIRVDNIEAHAIPNPVGTGTVRLSVFPIGHDRRCGFLAAGSRRPDFPTETERLLLGVGANQAAIVLLRKEAEEALRKQSEAMRITLASIGDAVITTDTQGRVMSLNPVAESLTGWHQKEACGRPLEDVFRIINEDSRQAVENPATKVLREGRIMGLANHTILIARDGTERAIDDSAAPIKDGQGNVTGIVLIFHDVSERRQADKAVRESEARKAAILQTALDCIITCDQHGRIVEFNPAAEQMFNLRRAEVLGRDLADLVIPPELRERHRHGMARYLATGAEIILNRRVEFVARRADGTEFPVELAITHIPAPGPPHFTAYLRDLTERKNLERRRSVRLAIIQVLAQTVQLKEAATRILQAVCEGLGWDLGAFWTVDQEASVLRCQELWHTVSLGAEAFTECCGQWTFDPGIGLPGRVWSSGRPAWIPDAAKDTNFPRASIAIKEGLHGAFGAPILSGSEVLGVIEFFSREIREPDPDLLEMMATIGGQIGQFIDRQRAEETLRQSEAQFRQLADALPQIVWTARPDGYIDYYNERWYEYTGFPRGEYGDQSWKPILHPDDVQRCVDTYYGCIRSGDVYQIEYRFKDRKTGGYRWFLGRAYPVRDAHGRIIHWFGTCTDIDDTKRAEETTRFLADASATLAELTDYKSTLQRVASLAVPQFADWCTVDMQKADGSVRRLAVTHSDPAKVQLAHELFRRYPPRPADPHGIMAVLRSGEPEWSAAIPDSLRTALAQDEEHLRIMRDLGLKSYICVPLRSRAKLLGVLTFATAESGRVYDADDLRAAEDLAARAAIAIENANLLATLKETDRRKDEFLAMLAHELRNPLAPIRNAIQIIRAKGPPVPELHWARDVIDRQVQQMTRLVDDLLDVSRITRGKIELRKERVPLATIVNSAVEASRPLIEKWRHELTVTLPPEPVYLEADQTRLAQVLLNLLNNAAKYTEQGGHIWLTAEWEGERVVFRVKDTGIGIPQEMLSHIFEIFTQVDRSLERTHGGLGIGLTLAQTLVEMHGGTVEAHSPGPGKGSEFIVRLPLAAEVKDPRARGARDVKERAVPAKSRILVVDDNQDSAHSLAMLLRIMGNEVHTAHDGLEAVGAAAVFRPDVVLLDIGLPKLNGYEAGRRIREQQGKAVVLVALTGWGQEEDRRRSKAAGFDYHLTKPVDFDALQKLLAGRKENR